jgi:hypothetical protein
LAQGTPGQRLRQAGSEGRLVNRQKKVVPSLARLPDVAFPPSLAVPDPSDFQGRLTAIREALLFSAEPPYEWP